MARSPRGGAVTARNLCFNAGKAGRVPCTRSLARPRSVAEGLVLVKPHGRSHYSTVPPEKRKAHARLRGAFGGLALSGPPVLRRLCAVAAVLVVVSSLLGGVCCVVACCCSVARCCCLLPFCRWPVLALCRLRCRCCAGRLVGVVGSVLRVVLLPSSRRFSLRCRRRVGSRSPLRFAASPAPLFFWEVFVVLLLRFWGRFSSWSVVVRFAFRWGRGRACVAVACPSRSAAARLLWRFRAARRWVRARWRAGFGGVLVPPARVLASEVPRFGLRWLACRRCSVLVLCARVPSAVPRSRLVRVLRG